MTATAIGEGRPIETSLVSRPKPPGPGRADLAGSDNWPHTTRVLPWLLAAFLAMIFLIPFDSTIFKVHLPANATMDRVLLVLMVAAFAGGRLVQRRNTPRRRLTPVEVAVLAFGAVALLSIVLNIDRIYQQGQLSFVEKQFSQLIAFGVFFFIVVATVRPAEMRAFSRLVLGLACLTAIGTIYESRTGINVFYLWSAHLLHPVATVAKSPTVIHQIDGRKIIVGPTQHGLALASMLTIALPFAVLPLLEARRVGERIRYLVIIGLILGADLSTDEKSAVFAPLAVMIVLIAYKRQLLRWAPIAVIVLVPVIHFTSPGALGGIRNIIPIGGSADYTDGRAGDYSAVAPDILNNVVFGRGYGTLDTSNWRTYRILDNQYLDTLFVVGVVGLAAYLALIFTAMMTAHGVIKRGGVRAPPALAAAAGCAAFGLLSATYDAGGFPQALYSFLFAAGLIAVAAGKRSNAPLPEPAVHVTTPPLRPRRARVFVSDRRRSHPGLPAAEPPI